MAKNFPSKQFEFIDTSFANLMSKRIYNILLYATKYDSFILEDDGRIDEQLFNEYTSLNLRYPPRFTQVSTEKDALKALAENHYELIIYMPNLDDEDILLSMKNIKLSNPQIPFVVLAPFSQELRKRISQQNLSFIDYAFGWLGNSELLLAIVKLMEDAMNVEHDTAEVGVQVILLVENSVRFYSSELPILYRLVLEESDSFSTEALNGHQQMLRKRGRPKILLARTYEEAVCLYDKYKEYMLGVVTDMRFSREKQKDSQAGYKLAKYIKENDRHLPVIIASSDSKNKCFADELGFGFLDKNSKSFPLDLRNMVRENFYLGELVIINPNTREEILRISNLRDLQTKLESIPEDSLRYHTEQNHFSRFCNSRAIFPVGHFLKHIDIQNYTIEDARRIIAESVNRYRKMKNTGIVAVFEKERFDHWSNFARIGNGSLGGKGRGLAFMGHLVKTNPRLNAFPDLPVMIPQTVVLCTDIFDEFMEANALYELALSNADDDKILNAFLKANLPERLSEDLLTFLETVKNPIAVRSSSMLEDSHYQPFAGIYSTYMLPYFSDKYETLRMLSESIKGVYASVFFKESKAYMTVTKNLIDQEKMAIVLQELVGETHETHFYPTISGVARSLNFYPIGDEKTEDGVVNLALGLGKYIVDGGQSLRYSPSCPTRILQLSSVEMALKDTQKHFLALDVKNLPTHFQVDDAFNLEKLNLKTAENEGTLKYIASTYDLEDNVIREGLYSGGRKIISFAHILQHELFPLNEVLKNVLDVCRTEMGRPIEIEFAVNIRDKDDAQFYLLQIRPIVDNKLSLETDLQDIDKKKLILFSENALGHGIYSDIQDIVYVKTENYNAANNAKIADEIEQMNKKLNEQEKNYALIGPGRWGSSDPWLGIPVKWTFISQAQVIVELVLDNYRVEPSQGSHFFQNLTSFGAAYLTLSPSLNKEELWNLDFLNAQPADYESEYIRLVHFESPVVAKIDGRKGYGVIEKPTVILG